jgi:aerobic-type carbon monoxide dehydrogenase small subunit (CoxS/CutS family)
MGIMNENHVAITVTVNGITKRITTDPDRSILDALREDLNATGSGHRCGEGRCGGCVVLLDNKRVLSCDIPIIKADHRTITTI